MSKEHLLNNIHQFIQMLEGNGLTKRTIDWHKWNLTQLAQFTGNAKLTSKTISGYIKNLHERKLSPYSIRGRLRSIKKYCKWQSDKKGVPNPAEEIKLPRAPKYIPRGITKANLRKLIQEAKSKRDIAILYTLAETACRASELCNIKRENLNLSEGSILIRGKSGNERYLFITSTRTRKAIQHWLNEANNSTYLFTTDTGKKLCYNTLKEILRRLKARSNITGHCNAHSFRHAFARDYLLNGGDLASLSQILGHSSIETTLIYATFTQSELRQKHTKHSPISHL
jgi:integrase/recombinase XerD